MIEWRWFLIASFTSLLIIFMAGFLLGTRENPSTVVYSLNAKEKPEISLDKTTYDMGRLKVSATKEADFKLKNLGQKTLQIFELSSSCNCTSVKIVKKDWQSPEFGMHNQSKEIIEIQPQEEIKLTVTYRPFLMPVRGQVARQVFFSTNDPKVPRQTLIIKAEVYE